MKIPRFFIGCAIALFATGAASATTFNVTTYGATPNNDADDDSSAVKSAIQAAVAAGGTGHIVYFPNGTYKMTNGWNADALVELTGVNGGANKLTIQGQSQNGVLIIKGDVNKRCFLLKSSSNITISNLRTDESKLAFTQGVITSLNTGAKTVTFQIDSGYDSLTRADLAAVTLLRVFTDPAANGWDETYLPQIQSRVQTSPGVWTLTLNIPPLANWVGKKLLIWNNSAGGWGYDMIDCSNILIQDVSWHGGGYGNAFATNGCDGAITLRRFTLGVPPGSNRLVAGIGSHQGFSRGLLTIDQCDLSRFDDDGVNTLSPLANILAQIAGNVIKVEDWDWRVGDTVSLWDWTYQQHKERDRATITAAVRNPDTSWNLTLSKSVSIVKVGPRNPNRALGEQDGIDRLCNLDSVGTLVVTDSRISCDRARALLIKSHDSTIDSNFIYDSHFGLMAGTETYWAEGPQPRNLTIRNNVFENVDTPALDIGIFYSQASRDCTNIVMENNTFCNNGLRVPAFNVPQGVGLRVRNANGAYVRYNSFENCSNANIVVQDSTNVEVSGNRFGNSNSRAVNTPAGVDSTSVLWADNATNVTLANNVASGLGSYARALAITTGSVTGTGFDSGITLAGNVLANASFDANPPTQSPGSWSVRNANPTASYTERNGGSRTGALHLSHWSASAYSVFTYQTKTGLPNGLYDLKAWVRSSGGQSVCRMEIQNYGGVWQAANIPASATWTQVTIPNVNVTNGGCEIGFNSVASANQWLYVDDVEFASTNLASNPSFDATAATQTPPGWNTRVGNPAAEYTEPNGGSRTGALHLTHWQPAAYSAFTYQSKTGLANGLYTFRAWVRSSGGQSVCRMEVQGYGGAWTAANISSAASWTQISIPNINVTNGTCEIGFNSVASANQWLYVDDVEFFKQ